MRCVHILDSLYIVWFINMMVFQYHCISTVSHV